MPNDKLDRAEPGGSEDFESAVGVDFPLPKSRAELLERFASIAHALTFAHDLIVGTIQSEPMRFNKLENYFAEMAVLQALFGYQGVLIDGFLRDLTVSLEGSLSALDDPSTASPAARSNKKGVVVSFEIPPETRVPERCGKIGGAR